MAKKQKKQENDPTESVSRAKLTFQRRVRFRADFTTTVEVEVDPAELDDSNLTLEDFLEDAFDDAMFDIDIPELEHCVYCDGSFEIVTHKDVPTSALKSLAEQAE